MAVRSSLNLKGFSELLEDLAQAGQDVDQSAANALIAGGDIILEGKIELAPVGEAPEDPHPGQLKDSLYRTEPVQEGNLTIVEIGVFDGENLPSADLLRYANAQEFGYTRGGKHYPGKSFARAGYDKKKKAASSAMENSLKKDGML